MISTFVYGILFMALIPFCGRCDNWLRATLLIALFLFVLSVFAG